MLEFFAGLFNTSDFVAGWPRAGLRDGIAWLHISSDVAIFLAYTAIALGVLYILRTRESFPHRRLTYFFAFSLASCGVAHLIDATTFWEPWHRFLGIMKFETAVTSILMMVAFLPAVPRIIAQKTRSELEAEVRARIQKEQELTRLSDELKKSVVSATTYAQESAQQLHGFFQEALDPLCIFNNGELARFNAAFSQSLGWTKSQIKTMRPHELIHPEDVDKMEDAIEAATGGKTIHDLDIRLRAAYPANTFRVFSWKLVRGHVVGAAFGTARDVTVQRQQLLELDQSNKDLREFAYAASHDLKAPLRSIAGLAPLIKKRLGENITEDVDEYIGLITSRAHRLQTFLDALLKYAEVGRTNALISELDANEIVEELRQVYEDRATIRVMKPLPVFEARAVRFEQVLSNLVSNAVRHSPEAASIDIDVEDKDTHHIFSVRDYGPGIKPEYHEKVFEIFSTLDSRDSGKSESGVGLAIVQRILHVEGGAVGIRTPREGPGVIFWFSWPKKPLKDAQRQSSTFSMIPQPARDSEPPARV